MDRQKHILIVDDDKDVRRILENYAKFEGYTVSQAENGIQAINFCRTNSCDIVIMDIVMPHLDGFTACKEIRSQSDIPIIILSARSDNFDQIHGFEVGADDYVVKPFSPRILFLKIDAILRRVNLNTFSHSVLQAAEDFEIDFTSRIVTVEGKIVNLTPKEYDILFYLIKNRRTVVKRRLLLTRIWGSDFKGDERTLDTHIKLLRQSLGKYGKQIITLRGVGYRFDI